MHMKKTREIFISLVLFVLAGCSAVGQSTTRIFVVRHADRESGDDLNQAGMVRSNELKRVLFNTGIDSIFSTNFVRTTKTVRPLADAMGLPVLLYDSNPPLLQRIRSSSSGKTLLVAGHSNTVAQLIQSCGCRPPFMNIPDNQFDNLFLIILTRGTKKRRSGGSCQLLSMKYGAPTPAL